MDLSTLSMFQHSDKGRFVNVSLEIGTYFDED